MFVVHDFGVLQRRVDICWLVEKGFLASSPNVAVERIEERFGSKPNRLGTNCAGFTNLRGLISQIAMDGVPSLCNALFLVAPHTHWNPAPIVHTLDDGGERYWIGPQEGRPPYLAINFVFHESGPLPYEWVDVSCGLKPADLFLIWHFIAKLNTETIKAHWFDAPFPVGVSINYRFKRPFDPPAFSTIERPGPEPDGLACVSKGTVTDNLNRAQYGQVGWSSAQPPEVNDLEMSVLVELEQRLSLLPAAEASKLLNSILQEQ